MPLTKVFLMLIRNVNVIHVRPDTRQIQSLNSLPWKKESNQIFATCNLILDEIKKLPLVCELFCPSGSWEDFYKHMWIFFSISAFPIPECRGFEVILHYVKKVTLKSFLAQWFSEEDFYIKVCSYIIICKNGSLTVAPPYPQGP